MLKKTQRLTTRQFNEVMAKGKIVRSPLFLLRILDQAGPPNDPGSRVSAVAPTKVAKKAVERNRIRRRVYAAVRPILPLMKEGVRVLILAKTVPAASADLTAELRTVFAKAGILE